MLISSGETVIASAGAVVYRKLRRRGHRRHAHGAEKARLCRRGGNRRSAPRSLKREYERHARPKITRDIVISSCCHSVNLLIQKYFPKESAVPCRRSFAHAGALPRTLNSRYPRRKSGVYRPVRCQKGRGGRTTSGIVDAVLTYEELDRMVCRRKTWISLPRKSRTKQKESRARFFPTTGGILKTMQKDAPRIYLSGGGRRGKLHGGAAGYRKRQQCSNASSKCRPARAAASAVRSWKNTTVRPSKIIYAVARLCRRRRILTLRSQTR